MPTLTRAKAGSIGLPEGVKETGRRVDFRSDDFTLMIETKGYRLAWSRTSVCPCTPVNDQTQQPNPNCVLCKGTGWIFFKPEAGTIDEKKVGVLTDLHKKILGNEATVIRGLMSGISNDKNTFDHAGPWLEGMNSVSTRAENKLGKYDRLTDLDSVIVYFQLLTARATGELLIPKYPIVYPNLLRSETTVYVSGTDYNLVDGDIEWVAGRGPEEGALLTCHYLCHPTWRVMTHPHVTRVTPVSRKTPKPLTPQGDPIDMPVQGVVQYEWLLGRKNDD